MLEKFLSSTKMLISLGVVVILFLTMMITYSAFNGNQKTMVNKESRLSAKYQDNQNVLSAYKATIKEALGVADRSTEAQNEVLENAIRGRYTDGSSAKPGSGSAFSAILEAYPDVSKVSVSYEKVQSAIFAGREAFKNQQTALLDLLRDYDTWRNSGFIHSKIVSMVGAPSDNLEARIGKQVVTGKSALAQMKLIVTTADTKEAFDSGDDVPLDLAPEKK